MHEVVILNKDGVELDRRTVGTRQGAYLAAQHAAYMRHTSYCVIDGRMTVFQNHKVIFPVASPGQFELPLFQNAA